MKELLYKFDLLMLLVIIGLVGNDLFDKLSAWLNPKPPEKPHVFTAPTTGLFRVSGNIHKIDGTSEHFEMIKRMPLDTVFQKTPVKKSVSKKIKQKKQVTRKHK